MTTIIDHWPDILKVLGALYGVLSVINGFLRNVEAKTVLGAILDAIAFLTRSDAPGTFKLPGIRSGFANGISVPPAAMLPLLLIPFVLSACAYCKDSAHKDEPRCQAEAVASLCGTPAISKVVQQILPQVVLALVNDGWSTLLDQLVETLKQQGVQDALTAVTCAVENIDLNLSAPPGAARAASLNPSIVAGARAHATAWAAAHRVRQ
jgi:hypothetical protein